MKYYDSMIEEHLESIPHLPFYFKLEKFQMIFQLRKYP